MLVLFMSTEVLIFNLLHKCIKTRQERGPWVVQSVKRLTLDFSSGHDLMVDETEPRVGLTLTGWSLLMILSPSFSAPFLLALSLSLSQNK